MLQAGALPLGTTWTLRVNFTVTGILFDGSVCARSAVSETLLSGILGRTAPFVYVTRQTTKSSAPGVLPYGERLRLTTTVSKIEG